MKEKTKNGLIIHGAVNIALMAIMFLCIVGCGLLSNSQAIAVFKQYNGVIYAGDENSGKVSLMINVYWGTEYILSMLDVLDEYDAKCTFFVGKTWADQNPAMVKEMFDRGHEIGNHGSYHKEHGNLGYDENVKEIKGCHDSVYGITLYSMNLFAPPGGSYNKETVRAAEDLGYKTILWTRDTIDWRDRNSSVIYERATKDLASGDLILMHPTAETLQALKPILEYIKGKKLTPDTVSNTIKG